MRTKEGNSSKLLRDLRTKFAVPPPKYMQHRLIRCLQRVTGIPAYFFVLDEDYFKTWGKPPDKGTATSLTFYQGRAIYVGEEDSSQRNAVLHEYSHALVAKKVRTLSKFNYEANTDHELDTCAIECWLGFVSGYYTYEYLCEKLSEYCYLDDLWDEGPDGPIGKFVPHRLVYVEQIETLLHEFRLIAQKYPWAQETAKSLRVLHPSRIRKCLKEVDGVWKSPAVK